MIINRRKLNETLANQAPKALAPQIFKELEREFEKATRQLIAQFDQHEVTRELKGGPTASNVSNTLGGQGNLHGFIGFEATDRPIDPLRALIVENIKIIGKRTSRKNLTFSLEINVPTADEIAAVTPIPWAPGLSWAEGIEKGISGLGNYLVKKTGKSRSGQGIQVDVQVRSATFNTTNYLTTLLKDFVNILEKDIEI